MHKEATAELAIKLGKSDQSSSHKELAQIKLDRENLETYSRWVNMVIRSVRGTENEVLVMAINKIAKNVKLTPVDKNDTGA